MRATLETLCGCRRTMEVREDTEVVTIALSHLNADFINLDSVSDTPISVPVRDFVYWRTETYYPDEDIFSVPQSIKVFREVYHPVSVPKTEHVCEDFEIVEGLIKFFEQCKVCKKERL